MTFTETQGDLFALAPKNAYFAHCISADFALGAGVAVQFEKHYGLRRQLRSQFPEGGTVGDSVLVGRVFNLITKEKSWQKPTYEDFKESLFLMAAEIRALNTIRKNDEDDLIDVLCMPRIGCGLDRLEWAKVKPLIEEAFANFGDLFEVKVYFL